MYWSHAHTSTAPAALKPTLKQTRPTPGSIRRQPHIRRRPTYSEIVRNHSGSNVNESFIPQRVLPSAWPREERPLGTFQSPLDGLSEMNRERNRMHNSRSESNREEGGRNTSLPELQNTLMTLEQFNHRHRASREAITQNNRDGEIPDDETTREEEDDGPDSRYALTRARAIPPGTFMNDRDLQVLARQASGGTWDISEYFSWMSNPSDSTSPTSTSSAAAPGVQHSPEPIPLVEAGYESTSEDSASDPEMEEGLRRGSGISQGLRAEEQVRRQMMREDDWSRGEPEGLERWRRVMHVLQRRRSIRNGDHGGEEEEEDEEISPDGFGGRYPWE